MKTVRELINELDARIEAGGPPDAAQAQSFRQQFEHLIQAQAARISERDARIGGDWFRPEEIDLLKAYLRKGISSRIRSTRPVYQHLLISSEPEDLPEARRFAKRFADCAADFFEEARPVCVTEREIAGSVEKESAFGSEDSRILLIEDFRAETPERFEAGLEALGIGRYALILCCTEETADRVRDYAGNDYRLGRYLLRQRYRFSRKSVDDVLERCFQILWDDGKELTDEFREKLGLYVEAVYPDAVLQDREFVRDLLIRIEDTRAERLCFDNVLTARDVPYSRKAELLAEARRTEALDRPTPEETMAEEAAPEETAPEEAAVEAEVQEEPAVPEETSGAEAEKSAEEEAAPEEPAPKEAVAEEAALMLPDIIAHKTVDSGNTEVGTRGIVLLFLSINQRKKVIPEKYQYISDFDTEDAALYNGIHTNDAPIQYLLDCARKDGHSHVDIKPILSKEVEEDPIVNIQRFEKLLSAYCAANELPESFCSCEPISLKECSGPDQISNAVFREISEYLKNNTAAEGTSEGQSFYVDFTGGFRDVAMLMVSLIRYLEFTGCKLRQLIYGKFDRNMRGPYPIVDIRSIYDLFSIINGTGSFLETGNPFELQQALSSLPEKGKERDLLDAIQRFSEVMSICSVDGIEETVIQVRQALLELEKSGDAEGLNSRMLRYLVQTIESSMRLTQMVTYSDGRYQVNYPILIDWCLNNRLIQQATTIYTEKMPEFYYSDSQLRPAFFSGPLNRSVTYTFYTETVERTYKECVSRFTGKIRAITPCSDLDITGSKNNIKSRVNGQIKTAETEDPTLAKMYCNLRAYIKACYDPYGDLAPEPPAEVFHPDKETIKELLTAAQNPDSKYVRYFVWNKAVCDKYSDAQKNEQRVTYLKKAKSLELMKESGEASDYTEQQKMLLAYYLSVKIIRNQMNHASGDFDDVFTEYAMDVLKNQYGICLSDEADHTIDYDHIQSVLSKAIEFHMKFFADRFKNALHA